MHIVAIGWIYVVLMMSLAESSFVAGIMTFLFYGMLPVAIILYLSGGRQRRLRRAAAEKKAREEQSGDHRGAQPPSGVPPDSPT